MKQNIRLYIGDDLVDLSPDSSPVLTFQINDLANVSTANGNTTNQFSLPPTQRNRRIFGFPDVMPATTNAPYKPYPAKLVIDGFEIMNGIAEIRQATDKGIEVQVISGNTDFFDALPGQIYDMADSTSVSSGYGTKLLWSVYNNDPNPANNAIWDVDHAADSQTKTSGWLFPIVDYGDIPASFPFQGVINVRNQRPAFFLHSAIDILIRSTGYSVDTDRSSLMRDPLYQKLLIPFSNSDWEHSTDVQNSLSPDGMATVLGTSFVFNMGDPYNQQIPFNQRVYGPVTKSIEGTVEIVFGRIDMIGQTTGSHPSQITFSINIDQPGQPTIFTQLSVMLDEKAVSVGGGFKSESFYNLKIATDVSLVAGMSITSSFGVQDSNFTYFRIWSGATFTFTPTQTHVLWGQPFECERILPDMGQKDLLKDTLQRFGMICQTNNILKQITFASFKDIAANIPKAKDWSEKCLDMGKQTNFQLGSYLQYNWMRYQHDDTVPLGYMPRYFADDVITVKDSTLSPQNPIQDLFQSPFAPTINRPYINGTIARIAPPNSTDSYAVGSQPRILVDQKVDLRSLGFNPDGTAKTVVFADNDIAYATYTRTINGIISVPYFYKSDGEFNLCYCDKGGQTGLRNKYWKEAEHILQQSKKIVRFFMLTPRDIYELDLLTPIYLRQENAYFYLNKIDAWKKGYPVKVELVRL
jgi:hypothetical protein